jgi:Short C-terminal domain
MVFMRRRPLLRAAVVGGGAYAMGKRSAQRAAEQDQYADQQAQYADQQAPGPPTAPQAPAGGAGPSMLDQLNQLTALHQQGSLTDDEFATAKAKLLGS